ncbi:MAG: glycerate kinase [Candidatus Accumulibacter sp.]|uniref:glycerate kinase type-2 family protein n=1 Tax=Accumulibacter sp. TaxID=2053492 RepID=UPI001A4D3497|nr:glycerate kinase [Accumulibacter sp.]MBL8394977.1 glycerate kinase [Accumulibacter sp.]
MRDLAEFRFLHGLFAAATAAARPERCVPPQLPAERSGRLLVVGAGKASAAMARAVEEHWPGPLSGLVVTRYGFGVPCQRIAIVEAAHPLPDAAGQAAAIAILQRVSNLTPHDCVLALISGGGSALLAAPAAGISLADKQAITATLLKSGATIHEMNCVRKHLSAIKGGRLAAAAWPASVLTLAISDVAGDDPEVIASGPTVGDPGTCADALAVVDRHALHLPEQLRRRLQTGELETPKPGDPRLAKSEFRLVASPLMALAAAAEAARVAGVTPLILADGIEGEAREVARALAGIARSCIRHRTPARPPCVLLSAGEATVTIRGKGRGGRNSELMLAMALALQGQPGVHALAADTDGIDGSEDNAGALIGPHTLEQACALGLDARAALDDNDAYAFFSAIGDLLVSGPTLTNVNDFHAILVS